MSLKRVVSKSIANLQHSVKRLAIEEEDEGYMVYLFSPNSSD